MTKVLIIGPAWVGDMVMAQSLFKAIKQKNNETLIDVLAPNWTRPLLDRMPEVRKSHALTIERGKLSLIERYQIAKTLQKENYDEAILLPNSWKSALIPWFAKIPKRTGYRGEYRFGLVNDIRILDKKRHPLLIERFAALAYDKAFKSQAEVPHPSLETNPMSLENTLTKFSIIKKENPILALCPGAEFGPSKRWPEAHYSALAKEKLKAGWTVWLFGSKNDTEIAQKIEETLQGNCVNFTGKTSLSEAIDLLSLSTLVVTNDSGLMHIAAALGIPLVAVYGSTDPSFTPPLSRKSEVVRLALACSPCFKRECPLKHHDCMQKLEPNLVLRAIDRVLT